MSTVRYQKLKNMCLLVAGNIRERNDMMEEIMANRSRIKEHRLWWTWTRQKMFVRRTGQMGEINQTQQELTPEDGSNETLRTPAAVKPQRSRGRRRNLVS